MKTDAKTILITGGAKRIGEQIARTLHQAGHNIMVHYRSSKGAAHQLADQLNDLRPGSADTAQCDLLDINCIPGVLEKTVETFGKVDALINNASTFYPTPIELVNVEYWDDLIGSNLKAPTFMIKSAAPLLREQNGCIINIVDIYARKPLANHPVYCAAKAGLEMLTKSLANDLAPEIRVNAVSPGAILWPETNTDVPSQEELLTKIPLQRLGDPNDIANLVRFLIDEGHYITGQTIAVDGGRSVRF